MKESDGSRYPACGLPRRLANGLVLRWATEADIEEVVAFNRRIHSAETETGEDVAQATRDLMEGRHPTTHAGDFAVVIDEAAGGRIVCSMLLLSQTWAYDGLPFALGRPEWVGTDAAYRRQGLVRAAFEAIHARSAARGELVQGITGIPWYYRQFGYGLALNRGGSRLLPWPSPLEQVVGGRYRLRPATIEDGPLLGRLYALHCASSLVTRVRDASEWRWELLGTHPGSMYHRRFEILEDSQGEAAGYVQTQTDPRLGVPVVYEVAAAPGHSLRAVCLDMVGTFRGRTAATSTAPGVVFALGAAHPAYEALDGQWESERSPGAWYMRVADVAAFVGHITAVLEDRLRGSVMEGYSGVARLNFYRSQLRLAFAGGRLAEVGTFVPAHVSDGDACFPDLAFLDLLFGHRSLADLGYAYADCRVASGEAAVLLGILFPMRPSQPIMLG